MHRITFIATIAVILAAANIATAEESQTFSSEVIASFEYGGVPQKIFASTRNTQQISQAQYQFRYEPVFIPLLNKDTRDLAITEQSTIKGKRFFLPIVLSNEDTQARALIEILKKNPALVNYIDVSNVAPFATGEIRFDASDILLLAPSVALISNSVPPSSGKVSVIFEAPKNFMLSDFRAAVAAATLRYSYERDARQTTRNTIEVTFRQLQKSDLYIKLFGDAGTNAQTQYVSREDYRRLTENISTQLSTKTVIENRETFDASLRNRLLTLAEAHAEDVAFDSEKFKHSFSAADLDPDVIEKELNEKFTWSEGEHKYFVNKKGKIDSSLDLFGDLFSGTGNFSGEMTEDELTKTLEKYHLKTSFEGHKIIPKAINLLSMNPSTFDSDSSILELEVQVGPREKSTNIGGIQFSNGIGVAEGDWLPTYDITGNYKLSEDKGGGVVSLKVDRQTINGKLDTTGYLHKQTGAFVTPREFRIIQTRENKADHCTVIMEMHGFAFGPNSFCAVASIVPGSVTCDLAANYKEEVCGIGGSAGSDGDIIYIVPR